jgi:integrase
MSEDFTVKVHSYGPNRPLSLVYFDPISGKKVAKSAKTRDWREGERLAGEWQKELQAGRYAPPSKITWQEFRERYMQEHVASLKPKTAEVVRGALNHVERHLNPDKLIKVNAAALSTLQSRLRATGVKETTIASVLRHVKAALGWAVSVGMLATVPKVVMPKQAKGKKMKGRPITEEEFERLIFVVPKVRPEDSAAWVHYLTGVWLGGLRLRESVALSWDDDAPFAVDLSGRHPRLRIRGEAQKSGQDQLLPVVPDFGAFLLNTPAEERIGRVFRLDEVATGVPLLPHRVGEIVGKIGRKAGVVVSKADGKFATCHDLRRSFGSRWARKVMPAVLQRLMRHEDIQTTMGYYVDLDADEMADELWAAHPATIGNTPPTGNRTGNNRAETANPVKAAENVTADC